MTDNGKQAHSGSGTGNSETGTCTPAAAPVAGLWEKLRQLFVANRDASLRESLEGVIEQHGAENGEAGIRPDAHSMMLNLLDFGDKRVDDVMVPRADIISLDETASLRSLMTCFISAHHSRILVFRDTLDEPTGMVHIKDFLQWIDQKSRKSPARNGSGNATPAKPKNGLTVSARDMQSRISDCSLIRPVLFVPPSMAAGDLLVKMQSTRCHLAIVVDEYGGTDGLVSIEDLVEEIVGDIADEHDTDDADLIRLGSDGNYVADARATIEDVEQVLNVDLLPDELDEDTDTLGGMVFSMLGRVPVRGELVRHDSGIEFEILGADPRRIKKLKIHTQPKGMVPAPDPKPAPGS